jgi:hypothetical protein
MSELKACPFCGQVAYKDFNEVRHLNSQCPAWGFASLETWNTRPVEDALTAKIAELEQVITNIRGRCLYGNVSPDNILELLPPEGYNEQEKQ